MLSSQVGSEGLDFQFCDTIVNWDIPWNPMVVEQRIGRIDRIGQESDRLLIFNLVMKDTVEEKILKRLYTRIGIFENSIGSLEPILGEVIHELEHELLSRRLTTEEENRRIGDALLVIERQKRDLDRLEKESEALVGHDQVFEEKMERVKTLGRYISSNELEEFVVRALPKVVKNAYLEDPQTDSSGIRTRKLPYTSTLESKLLLHNGKCDQDTKRFINIMSSGVTLSFGGEHLGNCSQGVEVLHAAHPLIRMLLAGLDSKNQFSSYTLTASKVKCSDLKNSLYFFVWGIIEETGPFAGRSVIGVLCDVSGDEASILESPDAAEIMLHSLLRHGERYPEFQEPDPEIAEYLFKLCVDELYKRKKSSQNHQQNRVDAMLNRKIAAVQSSCSYKIDNRLERLQTQSNEQIIRLYEGEIRNTKAYLEAKLEEYEDQRNFVMNLNIRGAGFVEIL
jgi:hypothetical protein